MNEVLLRAEFSQTLIYDQTVQMKEGESILRIAILIALAVSTVAIRANAAMPGLSYDCKVTDFSAVPSDSMFSDFIKDSFSIAILEKDLIVTRTRPNGKKSSVKYIINGITDNAIFAGSIDQLGGRTSVALSSLSSPMKDNIDGTIVSFIPGMGFIWKINCSYQ